MERGERKLVLVVDDEAPIRALVRLALEPEFAVIEASNGQEGIEAVLRHRPDAVLLDVLMPDMDGRETLRRMRELVDTPVIMLTVLASDRDVAVGLHSGADEYVTKPFSLEVLTARIRAAVQWTGPIE